MVTLTVNHVDTMQTKGAAKSTKIKADSFTYLSLVNLGFTAVLGFIQKTGQGGCGPQS